MKKKYNLLIILACLILAIITFSKINALQKLDIIAIEQNNRNTSILYSDNTFYRWGDEGKIKLENIKQYKDDFILDNNNKLSYIEYDYSITDIAENIKSFGVEYGIDSYYITNNNVLYKYNRRDYENAVTNKILDNVEKISVYNHSVLILDKLNNLYAFGDNIFGNKVNNGEDIVDAPIIIAQNVKKFDTENKYYIDNNDDLYIIDSDLAFPHKIDSNVISAWHHNWKEYCYTKNNETYIYEYSISNGNIIDYSYKKILDEEVKKYECGYVITTANNLYNIYNGTLISKDIIDFKCFDIDCNKYIIDNKNNLYYFYYDEVGNIKKEYILNDVDKIIDEDLLIMKDGMILTKGSKDYDIANYGGQEQTSYNNFVTIKGLPNVPTELNPKEIVIKELPKIDYKVDDVLDLYINIYPFNAEDKQVTWSSSDNNIADVDNSGRVHFKSPGEVTIKVKLNNYNLNDEIKLIVHPKISKLEILEGDNITIDPYKSIKLTAKLFPDNIIEEDILWEYKNIDSNDGNIYFERYGDLKYNEINIYTSSPGKYEITATTKDGVYSDSIILNVFDINIKPSNNNLFERTLYIYLKESNKLDLNVKLSPETATNKITYESSDNSIATVSEDGVVTAYKDGKVIITIKVENEPSLERKYNILIFDNKISTQIGDIDQDGVVDILDLVKLRKNLAGME